MEDFVSFEIAKKLKEKGFPQHITEDAYIIDNYGEEKYNIGDRLPIQYVPDYMADVAAPTISQVLKWFREEKKIYICIDIANLGFFYLVKTFEWNNNHLIYNIDYLNDDDFKSYEEAAIAGIEYCLDNLI